MTPKNIICCLPADDVDQIAGSETPHRRRNALHNKHHVNTHPHLTPLSRDESNNAFSLLRGGAADHDDDVRMLSVRICDRSAARPQAN